MIPIDDNFNSALERLKRSIMDRQIGFPKPYYLLRKELTMPTEEQIDVALQESLAHWESNVRTYPDRGTQEEKGDWFDDKCRADWCALCILLNGCCTTMNCPLAHCALDIHPWNFLKWAIADGTSTISHVEAVRDHIKAVIDKRAKEKAERNVLVIYSDEASRGCQYRVIIRNELMVVQLHIKDGHEHWSDAVDSGAEARTLKRAIWHLRKQLQARDSK
jgi:hypothetical protein